MRKLLLLLALFVGIYCHAQAPMQDVVYLKNGSIIRGMIIEQVPNTSLKIQTSDGSVFAYSITEVEKMTKEMNVNAPRNNRSDYFSQKVDIKGYRGMVDFGGAIGVGDFGTGTVELSTSHGYQFNPYFFLGAGLGLHYNVSYETLFVPIFANVKVNFLNKKITPFFDAKIGYSLIDGSGFYINPTLGVSFGVGKKSALTFGIGYKAQMTELIFYYSSYSGYYNYGYSNENLGGVTLKLGFEF